MDMWETMRERHSVRSYTDERITGEARERLLACIEECNSEGGLNMQLVLDEPNAFNGFMAHYGKFSNVRNYIVLAGKKGSELQEKCGYYGERAVLLAQELGLNTCWVAMTYSRRKVAVRLASGEKLCIVIAVGYGTTDGTPHKIKTREEVIDGDEHKPEWFIRGIDAALLAPTAMNQQKFKFRLSGKGVSASAGRGFYSKIDLGIAKYHFELGAGKENFTWTK